MFIDQLDLFMASAKSEESENIERPREVKVSAPTQSTEEPQEKPIEPVQNHLTTRQWALLNLLKQNSFAEHRKTSQKEICDKLAKYGYKWRETSGENHDHCSTIWNDIATINLSYDTDKLIISDNYEYWLGNEEETLDFIDGLWNDLEPRLVRYWAYLKKVKRNGQGQLLSRRLEPVGENSKARSYIESYGKDRVSE
ncbi:MAG: hypothetical protein J6S85_16445 [Methanobrevibacter sp.]|nr:hypothetical protein [Methanobrevibacter sp.]